MAISHNPNDVRQDDTNVREAVRFGLVVAVVGVAFLVFAARRGRRGAGHPVGRRTAGLLPHLSGMAKPRDVVGLAGRRLAPADADAGGADDEHACLGRPRSVRWMTAPLSA